MRDYSNSAVLQNIVWGVIVTTIGLFVLSVFVVGVTDEIVLGSKHGTYTVR